MIKRRFYRTEHGDKDDDSSSSSDSDPEFEPQSPHDSDTDNPPSVESPHDVDDDVSGPTSLKPMSPSSSSSGYESEDSSGNEINEDSPDLHANDDEGESERDDKQSDITDHPIAGGVPNCVLKCKAVFKCRLCPKIVCLNEESLNTHLKSKRHSRSEKLLNSGKLKRILNSDGEEVVYDDCETHAERHARIMALAESTIPKKVKGRQRQRQRLKRKKQNVSDTKNSAGKKDNRAKRRRKNADSTS